MPFRDLPIACGGGILAKRYEVNVQFKCDFEPTKDTGVEKENLLLTTRDAIYGGSTEDMPLNYINKRSRKIDRVCTRNEPVSLGI
jgi:hypothetical protein